MQAPAAKLLPSFRKRPILTYNGLTIVMSHPSRFDTSDVLSAGGGYAFTQEMLRPQYNRMQCDIRLKDNREPLLDNTKCVLLLGEPAAQLWLNDPTASLGAIRGSPYLVNGIPHIASYLPQDAIDPTVDAENKFNPYLKSHYAEELEDDENETDELDEKSRHGRTKRRNYRFWLSKDVEKAKRILQFGGIPRPALSPVYHLCPPSETIIRELLQHKDEHFFIDIETDAAWNILCFSFAFSYGAVYTVPCLLHDYAWAYSSLPQIYRALAIAMRDNITVAHNGAGFDFFVFALKYRLPIGKRVQDTMLMQHRCYPEQEKSLGHCTSLWTYELFHKDEADFSYFTKEACMRLWKYNAKDVYTMMLIHKAIMEHAVKHPGLIQSIEQANRSIRPYLTTALQGIHYDQKKLEKTVKENDRLMMQYLRIIDLLIGPQTAKILKNRYHSGMPGSNPQCCMYFHEMLEYPVIAYGKTSKKTGKRNPSLGKKALLKLRLKHENPVIDLCLAYRILSKETGSLGFEPYRKKDENDLTTVTAE